MRNENDIVEDDIEKMSGGKVFNFLLLDRSSCQNILWATSSYAERGDGYQASDQITVKAITGKNKKVIVPRVLKAKTAQAGRTKQMAEVFTPAWLCKEMNDAIEKGLEEDGLYTDWKQKIAKTVLEISCGEGPFLVSRYDTTTGEPLAIENRIGILDKKLQLISQHVKTAKSWIKHAVTAYQSTYGYEWQGDSLLLAREAMFYSFLEYYSAKFDELPPEESMLKIADIISWNIWQMDGLKGVVPGSCHPEVDEKKPALIQDDLFDFDAKNVKQKPKQMTLACPGCFENNNEKHNGIYCKIINWKCRAHICFVDFGKEDVMKFDCVIGNPPYQEETIGENETFAPPVYHKFMDAAYKIGEKVMLITPARFLFNAGSTPKDWNKKMLADKHLKVLKFEQDSSKIFANTDIKGGVAVTYRDKTKDFGAIDIFTAYEELNSILKKVVAKGDESFSSIIYATESYKFTQEMHDDFPQIEAMLSKGHKYDFKTTVLDKLCNIVFFPEKPSDDEEYVKIIGLVKARREIYWIRRRYVKEAPNFESYKIFVPAANGAGSIGEVLSTPLIGRPLIGRPLIGHTQTFISIGSFKSEKYAENCLKYIKSKFARTMLGVLKITQHNPRSTWRYVPLQDFTAKSDIDWSKSVPEIDRQLYVKYGLDEKEVAFIEEKVRAMD